MISIILPTLNEAELLPATLAAIAGNDSPHEVIVVDAGSTDGTVGIALAGGARVLSSSRRQRAAQMNLGAQPARGEGLLFLHADTRLASGALANVEEALRNPQVVGGGFRRRFDSPSLCLRASAWLGGERARRLGWFLGDQAMFVRRGVFATLGGFGDLDLFEDLDLARRMKRVGRLVTLGPPVISSARRFAARGALMTTLADGWMAWRYLTGADPNRLAAAARTRQRRRSQAIPGGAEQKSPRRRQADEE